MPTVKVVTDATFHHDVLRASLPVLVEFWAPWCQPCKQLAPILDQIAQEQVDRLVVAKVDIDENPRTTTDHGVTSVPTIALFVNGAPVKLLSGARTKGRLLAQLADYLWSTERSS